MKRITLLLLGYFFVINSLSASKSDQVEIQKELPDSTAEGIQIQYNFMNNLDSLLNLWYIQHATIDTTGMVAGVEFDSIGIVPEFADSVYIERLAQINSVIDLPFNSIVRNFINVYTQRQRDRVEVMLGLTDFYFPIFEEVLEYHGLPQEFRILPIIESALNPRAVSRMGATGIWQFMYATGRMYGLDINSHVDERRDPIASSHAAALFLKDLYNIYNDWTLVIAAYNCGPGNVNKAIRRAGGHRDYWKIYYYLPRETRGYVPAFIAASYFLHYHEEHNLHTIPMTLPPTTDTIMISGLLHLKQVAEVLDIQIQTLRDLNPQYRLDIIPANRKQHSLKLPLASVGQFIDREQEIFAYKDSVFFNPNNVVNPTRLTSTNQAIPPGSTRVVYRVKKGDVLGTIAQRHNVRVSQIRGWNNLRGNLIRVGQRLTIYPPTATAERLGYIQPKQSQNANLSSDYVYHTVRRGDTLWDIAQQYPGVSHNDIKRLNNLSNDKVVPGQNLKIKPAG